LEFVPLVENELTPVRVDVHERALALERLGMALQELGRLLDPALLLVDAIDDLRVVVGDAKDFGGLVARHVLGLDQLDQAQPVFVFYALVATTAFFGFEDNCSLWLIFRHCYVHRKSQI